jgi:hypothetical protein
METWYEIEYSYNRPGSEKIIYKGLKTFNTLEETEKFAAVVYCLSRKNKTEYDYQYIKISQKYLGKGKFVALRKIYKCTKKEVKIKIDE